MWYGCHVELFDMKQGHITGAFRLDLIAERARALLPTRNNDELRAAAATVELFIEEFYEGFVLAKYGPDLDLEALEEMLESGFRELHDF